MTMDSQDRTSHASISFILPEDGDSISRSLAAELELKLTVEEGIRLLWELEMIARKQTRLWSWDGLSCEFQQATLNKDLH